MFLEAWILLGIFGVALVALLIWSHYVKTRKQHGYKWKPEQDYDVVQHGETSMNPPFPHLIKRNEVRTGNEADKGLDTKQRSDTGE